jgi:hypothetical protein
MYHNAMTPPATGEITPITKCQRTNPPSSAQAVTPCDVMNTLIIALQAATEAKAAAAAAEMDDKEEETNPPSDNASQHTPASSPAMWCICTPP